MPQGPWHQHAAAAEERGSFGDIHLEPEVGEEGWTVLPVRSATRPAECWVGPSKEGDEECNKNLGTSGVLNVAVTLWR